MMKRNEELPIPSNVTSANQKMEMARIWLVDGEQIVSLSSNLWDDPGAWGLMLVDLAKHVAQAYALQGRNPHETLTRIKSAMDAEWQHPTS
jgi:hypothetical protein